MKSLRSRQPAKPSNRYLTPDDLLRSSAVRYPITRIEETDHESDEAEVSSSEDESEQKSKRLPAATVNFRHLHNNGKKSSQFPAASHFILPISLSGNSAPDSSVSLSTSSGPQSPAARKPMSGLDDIVECCEDLAAEQKKTESAPREGEEDISSDTSFAKTYKEVQENMISHQDMKRFLVRGRHMADLCLGAGEHSPRAAVWDFREGQLEKRSTSLLTSWKDKYCRAGHSQFMFFRNLQSGLLSGLVDFRRIPARLTNDRAALAFT